MMELYGEQAGQWLDPLDTMSHCVGNMMNQAIFSVRYIVRGVLQHLLRQQLGATILLLLYERVDLLEEFITQT